MSGTESDKEAADALAVAADGMAQTETPGLGAPNEPDPEGDPEAPEPAAEMVGDEEIDALEDPDADEPVFDVAEQDGAPDELSRLAAGQIVEEDEGTDESDDDDDDEG